MSGKKTSWSSESLKAVNCGEQGNELMKNGIEKKVCGWRTVEWRYSHHAFSLENESGIIRMKCVRPVNYFCLHELGLKSSLRCQSICVSSVRKVFFRNSSNILGRSCCCFWRGPMKGDNRAENRDLQWNNFEMANDAETLELKISRQFLFVHRVEWSFLVLFDLHLHVALFAIEGKENTSLAHCRQFHNAEALEMIKKDFVQNSAELMLGACRVWISCVTLLYLLE